MAQRLRQMAESDSTVISPHPRVVADRFRNHAR
jgi:hypothetical protein